MRIASFGLGILLVGLVGCDTGEGGTIVVPCDDARCAETCVEDGNETGECRGDMDMEMCVCQPRLDIPEGHTSGLSSGGVVDRRSDSFQLSVTVGPTAPSAERAGPTNDIETGILPQTDPERVPPAP